MLSTCHYEATLDNPGKVVATGEVPQDWVKVSLLASRGAIKMTRRTIASP